MVSLSYSKALSITELVVGGLLFVVGLATSGYLQAGVGVLLFVLGILMLINPIVVVTESEVQLRSPLGFTVRRHPISGPADLRADDKQLVYVPTGKKVASLGFGMSKDDVAKIRAAFAGPPAG